MLFSPLFLIVSVMSILLTAANPHATTTTMPTSGLVLERDFYDVPPHSSATPIHRAPPIPATPRASSTMHAVPSLAITTTPAPLPPLPLYADLRTSQSTSTIPGFAPGNKTGEDTKQSLAFCSKRVQDGFGWTFNVAALIGGICNWGGGRWDIAHGGKRVKVSTFTCALFFGVVALLSKGIEKACSTEMPTGRKWFEFSETAVVFFFALDNAWLKMMKKFGDDGIIGVKNAFKACQNHSLYLYYDIAVPTANAIRLQVGILALRLDVVRITVQTLISAKIAKPLATKIRQSAQMFSTGLDAARTTMEAWLRAARRRPREAINATAPEALV